MRAVLGDLVFGVDDETIEHAVAELLLDQGLTLGLAESLTGGLMAARLVDVPGASDVLPRRRRELRLRGQVRTCSTCPIGPVVTAAAAEAMAAGAAKVLGSDVGLAVTGVAGPEEQEGQPVGTVYIGLSMDGEVESTQVRLPGDRRQVREFTSISAFNWLRLRLLDRARSRSIDVM